MSRKLKKKMTSKSGRKIIDYQSVLSKASTAQNEGRLVEAEKGFLKVLKRKPHWGQVLNALGTVYLDMAQVEKARKAFEKATRLNPPNLAACYNLAWLKQRDNDHQGAIPIYKSILEQQPDNGGVWNNLGMAHREIGNIDESMSCFKHAVKFAAEMPEAWNNLGVAQDELGQHEGAALSYRKAIEIHPDYTSAHFNLGSSLHKLKQFSEAEEHFKKVLDIEPENEPATFMLQSLGAISVTPEAAPVEHVRRIFDQCATTFEKTLVKDLEYKTPELLFDLVRPHLHEEINILDLGCGTGLGAQLYRPFAKTLTGVDVSPKMLEKAREKNIFDKLESFDILQEWNFFAGFDLIYSSDVFVYFGNLEKITQSISANLNDGGLLAFSVERKNGSNGDYSLHTSGRYAHSQEYVLNCLAQCGLQIIEKARCDIRKQSGNHVEGLLIVAKKES